jgi:hypothetical protein
MGRIEARTERRRACRLVGLGRRDGELLLQREQTNIVATRSNDKDAIDFALQSRRDIGLIFSVSIS